MAIKSTYSEWGTKTHRQLLHKEQLTRIPLFLPQRIITQLKIKNGETFAAGKLLS